MYAVLVQVEVSQSGEHLQRIKTNYFQWLWSFLKNDTDICKVAPDKDIVSMAGTRRFTKLL